MLQLFVSGLANGCVYGLVALGFVLIYKATEAVNFAQGDFMMLGAFICLGLTNAEFLGLPFWVSVPIAVVVMGAFGYAIDMTIIRRMFGQSQIAVVILTIALGFVLRFLAGVIWGHEPVALQSPIAGRDVSFGGLVLGLDEVFVVVTTVVLTVALYFYFNRTRLGVAMQAASQNQLAAYYMGIPVRRVNSLVWALAGAVAAVAGILFASKGSIDPSIGLLGIKAFAAAVIGGFGSLPGALVGGIIVGLIEPFASYYIAAGYSQVMPYLLLFLILVFRPHGIVAQVHRKKV
ncbi:branched-chain amino acid ABC transporter permease [Aquibium sp. A9E412]|uniref:branched-chain amino acid ABC transporter permease n=1 Tax=Aquibium sp. A9E412 TaxID=2976767 RepID=UPI0025AF6097|nr:branched-chain amino acid ABC transporter permease [Aquibium sp. A9E412]MDN2565097.1 branched-chain amino acid ABC transporter permease [Aquibium sp. A9E412]